MWGIEKMKIFHRNSFVYLIVSLVLALTGAIYEHYSHGVYSYSMIYAFAAPLILGTLVNMILERLKAWYPGHLTRQFWHCGVGTLTVGLLISGVFQIYGSANSLLNLYYVAGFIMVIAGAVLYFTRDRQYTEEEQ